jgi:sugar lactone lactonase YvrE
MSSKPPRLTTCIEASRAEVAHAVSCELGEGALWHAELGVYLHVDIYGPSKLCAGPAVFLHDPYDAAAPPARCLPMPSFCGTVVPRASGGLLVALKDGVHALDLRSGALSFLLNPDGVATNRWNEGKCSPEGRFWAGTMGEPGKVKDNVGALYCIHADLTAARVVPDVTISNGLAWDVARKVMYFIDTPKSCVFAFDYDAASGAATNQRVAFRIPEGTGHPDGCCLDSEGNLWIAQWGGSRVCAYDPADGSVIAEASARAARARRWTSRAFARAWRASVRSSLCPDHLVALSPPLPPPLPPPPSPPPPPPPSSLAHSAGPPPVRERKLVHVRRAGPQGSLHHDGQGAPLG